MGFEIDDEEGLWKAVASTDEHERVDALLQLSYNAASRGEYVDSLTFCETAKDVYEGTGAKANSTKLAHIYFGLGHCLRHLDRAHDAAEMLAKSVALYQEAGSEDALHLLNEEGDAWYEAEEYQKSFDAYQRAIEDANPDTCDAIIAKNYADAGSALEKLKNWQKALEYFLEARTRYKKLKDLRTIAHCDEEISLAYIWLKNGDMAVIHAQYALDFAVTAEDEVHLMWAKARMALAKKTIGHHQEALQLYAEAKSIMVKQVNPPWKAILKLEKQVASTLKKMGKVDEAAEVLRRISSIQEIFLDENEGGTPDA